MPLNWLEDFVSYNSGVIMLVISNHSPDYSLICTLLSPITITNHNYIKILESDWSSAGLISRNWTVAHVMRL